MIHYKKILLIFSFIGLAFSAYAESKSLTHKSLEPVATVEYKDVRTMTFDILINGASKVRMNDVPTAGSLDVFSILGVKVTSVNLKECANGYSMDLTKGLYILKAGRVAQKVIVR